MKKLLFALIILLFVILLTLPALAACPGGNAYCAFWKNALTGGADNALDGIAAAIPTDNSAAFVVTSTDVYVYTYDTTSGATENSPNVIAPDDAGNERWLLVRTYSRMTVINKGAGATLTASEMNGIVFVTATAEIKLPPVIIGDVVMIYSTTAAAVHVNPDDADRIVLDGTVLDDGDKVSSASGAGDFIVLVGDSASGWRTLGRSGMWSDGD